MKAVDDPRIDDGIFYPESDGLRIAENTLQYDWIALIKSNLARLYRERTDVLVAADNFIYPVRGRPTIVQAPDIYVAIGRPAGHRGSYRVWREGNLFPQVVVEVLSPSNTPPEMTRKRGFYERYGALEYVQIDPDQDTVRIWTREGNRLEEVESVIGFVSPNTGMQFLRDVLDGLIVFGPDGQQFYTLNDAEDRLNDAIEREVRSVAELRKERRIARAERKRADAVEEKLETERQKATEAISVKDRLAAKLRELGIDPETLT
jgi:Uma2 family endonuclease